jgi:hypothetical protein
LTRHSDLLGWMGWKGGGSFRLSTGRRSAAWSNVPSRVFCREAYAKHRELLIYFAIIPLRGCTEQVEVAGKALDEAVNKALRFPFQDWRGFRGRVRRAPPPRWGPAGDGDSS